MKKILVPCDFSKPAINAFRVALDVAGQSNGKIYLMNVLELPVIHDTLLTPVATFKQDFLSGWKENIITELNSLIAKYKTDVKIIPCAEVGSPAQVIKEFCEENSIDIVIMGSHGANGFREFLIGSTAEKVVRYSPVPVLVIKQYYKGPIKHIVFPNTLETEGQQDLTMKVKALQAFFKATVHIVFINTPSNFTADIVTSPRLKAFVRHFMFKDYTINIYNDQYEEDGIMNFTKSIKGNLIAMGTHARKGIPHMINGSVAENVVNHTDTPIWTYASK